MIKQMDSILSADLPDTPRAPNYGHKLGDKGEQNCQGQDGRQGEQGPGGQEGAARDKGPAGLNGPQEPPGA